MSRPRRAPRILWLAILIGAAYLVWRWRRQQADELALPASYDATNTIRPSLGGTAPGAAQQEPSAGPRRIPTRVHRGAPPSRPAAPAPADAPSAEPPPPDTPAEPAGDLGAASLAPATLLGAAEELAASTPVPDPALAGADELPDTMPPAPDGVPETVAPTDAENATIFTPGLAPDPSGEAPEVISAGSPDTISEEREPTPPSAAVASSGVGLVNINTADEDALVALPGIGRALARRIIAHREEHGPFASVDALVDIQGIGPRNIDDFRAFVTV